MLIEQFFVLSMKTEPLFFQFFNFYELGIEQSFEFCLFLLDLAEFVGSVAQFSPKEVYFLLELVDGFECEFEFEFALFVCFGLSG